MNPYNRLQDALDNIHETEKSIQEIREQAKNKAIRDDELELLRIKRMLRELSD